MCDSRLETYRMTNYSSFIKFYQFWHVFVHSAADKIVCVCVPCQKFQFEYCIHLDDFCFVAHFQLEQTNSFDSQIKLCVLYLKQLPFLPKTYSTDNKSFWHSSKLHCEFNYLFDFMQDLQNCEKIHNKNRSW